MIPSLCRTWGQSGSCVWVGCNLREARSRGDNIWQKRKWSRAWSVLGLRNTTEGKSFVFRYSLMYKKVLWAIRAVWLLHLKEKGYGSISVIKAKRARGGSQRENSGFNLLSVQSPRDVGVAILPKQNWVEENRLEAVSQMCELMVAQLIFEIAGRVRIIGTFTGTFLPGFYSPDPIKTHTQLNNS